MFQIKFQRYKEREQHFGHIGLLSYSQGSDVTAPLIRCLTEYDGNITPQYLDLLNRSSRESMELPVTRCYSPAL